MDKTRLRWACRRGMLELDLLLSPFLENAFSHLNTDQQQLFELFLTENDQDLYAWILGFKDCPIENFYPLLTEIRRYHAIK
jgi:antitoxin CptB